MNDDIPAINRIVLSTRCPRCGQLGHTLDECLRDAGARDAPLDDNLMRGPTDPQGFRSLPKEMIQTSLSYLPSQDVIPAVPRTNRQLNEDVWHPWSRSLLWGEMHDGNVLERRHDQYYRVLVPGDTILMHAIKYGAPIEHIKRLVGNDVNKRNSKNFTALFYAVFDTYNDAFNHNKSEVVQILLDAGANPNETYSVGYDNGYTPLLRAIHRERPISIIRTLISCNRTNVNQQTRYIREGVINPTPRNGEGPNEGFTALMIAVINDYYGDDGNMVQIARMLIAAGADLSIRNDRGQTAFDLTVPDSGGRFKSRHHDMRKVLLAGPRYVLLGLV